MTFSGADWIDPTREAVVGAERLLKWKEDLSNFERNAASCVEESGIMPVDGRGSSVLEDDAPFRCDARPGKFFNGFGGGGGDGNAILFVFDRPSSISLPIRELDVDRFASQLDDWMAYESTGSPNVRSPNDVRFVVTRSFAVAEVVGSGDAGFAANTSHPPSTCLGGAAPSRRREN
jgi:hypothetical protein